MKFRTIFALCITALGICLVAVAMIVLFIKGFDYPQTPIWLPGLSLPLGAYIMVGGIFLLYRFPNRGRAIVSYLVAASCTWGLLLVLVVAFYPDTSVDRTTSWEGGVFLFGLPLLVLGLLMFRTSRHRPKNQQVSSPIKPNMLVVTDQRRARSIPGTVIKFELGSLIYGNVGLLYRSNIF